MLASDLKGLFLYWFMKKNRYDVHKVIVNSLDANSLLVVVRFTEVVGAWSVNTAGVLIVDEVRRRPKVC